jgi:hypothetical protein
MCTADKRNGMGQVVIYCPTVRSSLVLLEAISTQCHGKGVNGWKSPDKQTIARNERCINCFLKEIKDEKAREM